MEDSKEERIKRAFFWIVKILERLNIPYEFTGGFAAKAYGAPRPLNDIDLELPDELISKLAEETRPYIILGPERYVDDNWDLDVVTLKFENIEVDCAGIKARIFNENTKLWEDLGSDLAQSEKREIFGRLVPVMPLKQLLAYKSKLLRDVDKQDLEFFSKSAS